MAAHSKSYRRSGNTCRLWDCWNCSPHHGKAKPAAARGHTADDSQSKSHLTVTEIKPEYLK